MSANVQIINTANHDFKTSNYYCYVLKDPENNQPFYVGKGKRDRVFHHQYSCTHGNNEHKRNKINKILDVSGYYLAEIVFTTSSEVVALQREIELISSIGRVNLVNATDGGELPSFITEKTPVKQYNLYGEYIQTFDSYMDAAASFDGSRITEGMILECCRGAIATARDYYWTYEGNPILRPRTKIQPVAQFYANNEYITRYHSASDACQALKGKINMSADIRRAAKNDKTCCGFRWRFINVLTGEFTQEPLKPNKYSFPPVSQD